MKRLSIFVLFALITTMALAPPTRAQDDAAILPTDAVNSNEILDEPGAAQGINLSVTTLGGGHEVVASSIITPPVPGYVLVMVSGEITIGHVFGTRDVVNIGVSDDCDASPDLDNDQSKHSITLEDDPSGFITTIFAAQKIFADFTMQIPRTFCCVANKLNGITISVDRITLSVLFIPTAYGAVQQ